MCLRKLTLGVKPDSQIFNYYISLERFKWNVRCVLIWFLEPTHLRYTQRISWRKRKMNLYARGFKLQNPLFICCLMRFANEREYFSTATTYLTRTTCFFLIDIYWFDVNYAVLSDCTQIENDIDAANGNGKFRRIFSCKLIMDGICKLRMTTSSFETGRPNKGDTSIMSNMAKYIFGETEYSQCTSVSLLSIECQEHLELCSVRRWPTYT